MSEMMACQKMHARIPVTTCVGRQSKGILMKGDAGGVFSLVPVECRDCEAGRAALATGPGNGDMMPHRVPISQARTIKERKEPMAKTGPCKNCGRELSIIGNGCCWVCYKAGKGLEGEKKDAALAAVKKKINGGGLRRSGRRGRGRGKPHKSWPATDGDTMRHHVPIKAGVTSISLVFPEDRDRKIYDAVITMAKRLRREPEQQILWMLQNAIEQEAGLLAEASPRG